jgi:acetyl esterase
MHGGGWILGNLDTNDSVGWGFAQGTGAAVISVDYRLAPENPYPAAFDDSRAVLEYVAANGRKHGLDGSRIAVCGDSAGGNLSAALSLWSRDHSGPRIAAQALIYPVIDTDIDNDSYRQNATAPMLTRAEMMHYLDAYLGKQRQNPHMYAMPGRATDLRNLPPALVHTAEYDPLRDEGRGGWCTASFAPGSRARARKPSSISSAISYAAISGRYRPHSTLKCQRIFTLIGAL